MMGTSFRLRWSMRLESASASRFSRLLPIAATLLVIACGDSTTTPATPAKLAFTVQPVTSIGSMSIPTFRVAVQDAAGNTITNATNAITLGIAVNPGQDTLIGTKTVSAVNGVATFADVVLKNLANGYVLGATSGNLVPAASNVFDVTFGPASKLLFTSEPLTTTIAGAAIRPIEVIVLDIAGNTVASATNNITVAIGTNPGGGTLTGTTTVTPVNGIATFSNLSINNVGVGYTLTAAATSLTAATTSAFTIRNPFAFAFAAISAGYFHTCGLTTGGAAYCWGDNSSGQVGSTGIPGSFVPVEVSGGINFAKVIAGRSHTCGVNTGGIAYCWGASESGRLGTTGSQNGVPQTVSGSLTFAVASAGYGHTCGVTTGGVGYCWGDNIAGALGNGTLTQSNVPAAVSGGLTFASVSPGRYFTCGMTTAGVAYCWGDNFYGELGDGTQVQRTSPVAVLGQLNFAVVSAGGFHACGLATGGLAYCWGSNDFGQLGNGTVNSSSTPVAVSGGLTFVMLSAGNRHTCGVTTGGVAYCWGDNSSGHLGTGTTTNSSTPVAVAGGLTFASVSTGRFHSCGVTTGGAAYCWGGSSLGDGTTTFSLVPVPVR